jgi:hypothetical protein
MMHTYPSLFYPRAARALVAFIITAAAFAFVVLNMGFLTAEKGPVSNIQWNERGKQRDAR